MRVIAARGVDTAADRVVCRAEFESACGVLETAERTPAKPVGTTEGAHIDE
jgi:hypothetical protein